jgi:hypothetical protein
MPKAPDNPVRCFLLLFAHFRVWVKKILRFYFELLEAKNHRFPKKTVVFGAAIQI